MDGWRGANFRAAVDSRCDGGAGWGAHEVHVEAEEGQEGRTADSLADPALGSAADRERQREEGSVVQLPE